MAFSLKALRVNAEMTRPQVIEKLKIEKGIVLTVGTLANYENKTTSPDIATAQALASMYGVAVDDVCWGI